MAACDVLGITPHEFIELPHYEKRLIQESLPKYLKQKAKAGQM